VTGETRYRASCLCDNRAYFTSDDEVKILEWFGRHDGHVGALCEVVSHVRFSSDEFRRLCSDIMVRELEHELNGAQHPSRRIVTPVVWESR
jgi:hypothetical protein